LERMLDTLDVEAEAEAAVKWEQQQQLEQQLQERSNNRLPRRGSIGSRERSGGGGGVGSQRSSGDGRRSDRPMIDRQRRAVSSMH
jgi:hypothetical protein